MYGQYLPKKPRRVLILGSGMSYHNMRGLMSGTGRSHSEAFDGWLTSAVAKAPVERDAALTSWATAPSARESHPREEHLLPLMVVAGAAGDDRGRNILRDDVMGACVSALQFG